MKTAKTIFITLLSVLFFSFSQAQENQKILSTVVTGKGQSIILIHGMSCSSEVWEDFVERYQDSYELHLVNIKGFGNKEEVEKENILESIKDELIAYTKESKLNTPIIIGHSMGGFVGLWAAAEAPDLFGKVISVDGVPYFPVLQMPGITPESAKPIVAQMTSSMTSMNDEQMLENQRMIVNSMIATPSKRDAVIEMGMNSNPQVTGQAYGEMYMTDIRPLMAKIRVPVLVFGAWAGYKQFGATKESVAYGYKNQLKDIQNVDLLVAESAYHFVFYDEPDWFYSEVENFLK